MYRREDVEAYLPAVWSDSYLINPPRKKPKVSTAPRRLFKELKGDRLKRACDPNDRKTAANPAQSNTAWAELVDVRNGWREADLSDQERRVLLLRYHPGAMWEQAEIAFNQGISQQTVSRRIESGIGQMARWINGDEEYEEEEDE